MLGLLNQEKPSSVFGETGIRKLFVGCGKTRMRKAPSEEMEKRYEEEERGEWKGQKRTEVEVG